MRLKSLELVGFKSFVDRTIVNFEDGVTGIVGPNGCGKSNVVDAIRWVMGEQSAKHLRGSNMGDVIFNGTELRPPMGMASVFLTFDNADGRAPAEYADYTEIMVGRRLYRSGESEYYINKAPCRLKDIVDLFLGTGIGTKAYAIVEQGMIGQILSAKPEDRRMLIEEAAGISKFKMRKEAALRKMDATRSNLARLNDIITELERQMNSLYRQAKKAERFQQYNDELKGLELGVTAHQYKDLKGELGDLQHKLENIKETEVAGGSKLSQEEAEIESAKIKLSELEKELDVVQETLYEKQNDVQLTEAGITYKTKEVENLSSQIDRWSTEIGELKTKLTMWREELDAANTRKVLADLNADSARESLFGMDEELQGLRDQHHEVVLSLEDSRRQVFECVETVSSSGSNLEQLKRREIELSGWIAKDQAEIDRNDQQIEELEGKIGSGGGVLSGTKQLRLELAQEIESANETLNVQNDELIRVEEKVSGLKENLSKKRSRLNSLEELKNNFEGYKEGVRAILKRNEDVQEFQGIVGTINEIVETKPEYETAVGAVLGEKLQYIVVKSHDVGVEAIDYLKSQVTGRSTFVPVGIRNTEASASTHEGEGVVGPLVEHVSYSDDYKKIVDYLFKDVVLVKDLRKALNLWSDGSSGCTMVTLDGEVVDPAGIVTGGSGGDGSKQLMVHRREVKELTKAVATLTKELNIEEQMLLKLRERVGGLKKNINKMEQESHSEELKLVNQQKDIHHLEQELNFYRSGRDKLSVEVAALAQEQETVKKDQELARVKYEESSQLKTSHEEDVGEKQQKEAKLRDRVEQMVQKRTELNVQVRTEGERAENLTKEIDRLIHSVSEAYTGVVRRTSDMTVASYTIKTSNFGIECKKNALHELVVSIDELKSKHTEIKSRFDIDLAALGEKEAAIRDLRRAHEEHMKSIHEFELSFTQKQEKSNYMIREIFDRYRVDLDQSYQNYLAEDIDVELSAERVTELKEKVDKIGSVNVDAIHEYEELKTRFDFLVGQRDDLTTSMEDLQKAIQKINKTSKIRFQEAFDSVNERFQKLFPKLFQGGKARLVLTDEQSVLESGVDIIAQPPGKKLQSVTLLSGGEKALTAVALIFSLFLHRPSPFCLLDEVDAPLDDANIDRFNEIIREMTKLSQFILITHNKRTMELADTLYGVTMEERGASKVISLSLSNKKADAPAA
jgi:chromosome segregation protein